MKRFLVVAALLGLAVVARAEPQSWALTDGRTVTVVKVLSQNPTHVTVRCPDGILQIDKRQLPEALQAQYPYDEVAAAARQSAEAAASRAAQEQAARRAQLERARAPQRPSGGSAGGVAIVSIRPTGPALAYVTITNRTASMVEVNRDMFVGETVAGLRFPSQRFTNPRGDHLTRIRIAANATTEIGVVFEIPEGEVPDIGAVYWRQQ